MRKVIFNIGKSFYRLSTDVLPFQEKDCSIKVIIQVPWEMTPSAPCIIASSAVKELNAISTMLSMKQLFCHSYKFILEVNKQFFLWNICYSGE
jgi:hypothetical protein